eukprot:TRINITY_DN6064_c0_g1_i1.p1 TRINITY_DN6064_c0_g1~~TRINITY_DN6064_c0_g1_i1.p1  ORF type:complete len:100 (-),score=1.09 TRINITY_DN6064_c0_g1_i1:95-394(-)
MRFQRGWSITSILARTAFSKSYWHISTSLGVCFIGCIGWVTYMSSRTMFTHNDVNFSNPPSNPSLAVDRRVRKKLISDKDFIRQTKLNYSRSISQSSNK